MFGCFCLFHFTSVDFTLRVYLFVLPLDEKCIILPVLRQNE